MPMRTCHACATQTDTWCPTCVAAFPNRRPATEMTREERATEFDGLCGPLEIPIAMLHERVEELVGRSVWTHELVDVAALRREILGESEPATMANVVAKIPADKLLVVAVA